MGVKVDTLKQLVASKGLRYVGGRGIPTCGCWVVGEAPGADEDRLGLPFMGKSGQEQDRMLHDAGFAVCDTYFTNPYKVKPPENDIERITEYGIPTQTYIEAFLEELNEAKPAIIIAAGAIPLGILCPFTIAKGAAQITKYRGSLLSSPLLASPHYIIPVRHPAFVLREWSERGISVLVYAKGWEELSYLRQHGVLQALPIRSLRTEPTYSELYAYLSNIRRGREAASIDIETLRRRVVYTCAVAKSPTDSTSFCFWDYDASQSRTLFRLFDDILQSNWQIGQNYLTFDLHWLETLGFRGAPHLVHDTLLRHHVLWAELEHSLAFMGMQYTREPFWKDDGKLWTPKEGKQKLMRYNALDAAVTYEVFLAQEKELGA